MKISRRDWVVLGTLTSLGALFAPRALHADVITVPPDAVTGSELDALLSRTTFLQQLKREFVVEQPSGDLRLRLVKVEDVPSAEAGRTQGSEECFVAVFQGPLSPQLAQGTYTVRHRSLGTFLLFLVPAGETLKAYRYTATINRCQG